MSSASPISGRKPSHFYPTVSVALVLFVLGFFGFWLLQAGHLSKTLKENVDIIVELEDEIGDDARNEFTAQLISRPYVRPGSVRFTDRQTALRELGEDLGEDLAQLDLTNPLHDVITFNVYAATLRSDSLERISTQLRAGPAVADVYYQDNFIDRVADNARTIGLIALVAGLLFVVIAVVLIHNTVRLTLHADRFLIKTQELVGATWGFISRPYLRRALLRGFISGLLAVIGLLAMLLWINSQVPDLRVFARPELLLPLAAGLLVLGVAINWLSNYFTIRKYLRLRVDELY